MKSFALVLGSIIATQSAFAGEIVTVRGSANGPKSSHTEALYYSAKAEAIGQLPFKQYRQVSGWETSVVDVGAHRYVGAKASFESENANVVE